MRFFRHGDALAIVLPEKLRKSSAIGENSEYEFFESEPGVFILASRQKLEEIIKRRVLGAAAETPPQPPEEAVFTKGCAILENEEQAKLVSQKLEKQIKAGQVFGVRGFDKRFYLVSSTFLDRHSGRILAALASKDLSLSDIAAASSLEEKACLTLLQVMKEKGDVIEKKKGVFKAVG